MTTPDYGLRDIQIRDPYLLTVPTEAAYYLYGSTDADIWNPPGTGFDCYRSTDLQTWEGPMPAFRPPSGFWADRNFWAPEVHVHAGRYYMFATFKAQGVARGTQILAADHPQGPFTPWSDGPVTPHDWECLDGTLFVDDAGDPWIVFCHEWVQATDGEIHAQRLTADLTRATGDTVLLFRASDAPWARPVRHPDLPAGTAAYVTDGPFLHRLASGVLLMLWSSFGDVGYAMGVARSTSGRIDGPWEHLPDPIWARDGGHGMIARTLDGDLLLTLHQPNTTPLERAELWHLRETADGIEVTRRHPASAHGTRPDPAANLVDLDAPLTADDTIGRWLDDQHGAAALTGLLASLGLEADALAGVRATPLTTLVAMSQGRLSRDVVDSIVAHATQSRATAQATEEPS